MPCYNPPVLALNMAELTGKAARCSTLYETNDPIAESAQKCAWLY